ncbi:MAG: amidohydrolase family protein [Rhodobacteraceae bacterium]|nr:amidohydrolase family protein [Paracoccaceae bacterium]
MTDFLITNIEHGLTGADGGAQARFSGALRVRGGRIAAMGALTPDPAERVIDARGAVVCPGMINTHHHLFQSVLKAVPAGMNTPLDPWLMHVPFTWWPHLDERAFRTAATIGMAELALSGVTTVCDHHYIYSDRYEFDPNDVLFDVAARFGMRFVLARGGGTKGRVFDDPSVPPVPVEPLETYLDGVLSAASRWHDPAPDAMTRVVMGPNTPIFNFAAGELRELAQTARAAGLRLHAHLSENHAYVDYTLAHYGQRPVPWLAGQDMLGPDVWFAHLVEIDAAEIALLAGTGTGMAHCPQANARLGSGVAPADALHDAGGVVSLAVDGAGANEAADMGSALYAAFCLHRATKGATALAAETVLHWATMGGARVLGMGAIGQLAPGMAADIAIIDISAPRYMGQHDASIGPIISGGGLHIRHSFVAGREIVRDGAVAGLNLAALSHDARQITRDLITRQKGGYAPHRACAAQS